MQVSVLTTRWFGLRADTKLESRTLKREVTTPRSRWYLDRRGQLKDQIRAWNYGEDHCVEQYYRVWNADRVVDWESWEDGM